MLRTCFPLQSSNNRANQGSDFFATPHHLTGFRFPVPLYDEERQHSFLFGLMDQIEGGRGHQISILHTGPPKHERAVPRKPERPKESDSASHTALVELSASFLYDHLSRSGCGGRIRGAWTVPVFPPDPFKTAECGTTTTRREGRKRRNRDGP